MENEPETDKKYEHCLDCGCPLEIVGSGVVGAWARMSTTIGKHLGFVCNLCHFGIKQEDEIYEWEFPEPSSCVDLERVCDEVNSIPLIHAKMYMHELEKKAPIVYKRLKEWAIQNKKMQWRNDFCVDNIRGLYEKTSEERIQTNVF